MKFSLLIAHYNSGSFFEKCYESILQQNTPNLEVIIIDDCSTDSSIEAIENLVSGNPQVKIYKNDKNYGVGFTKRKCVKLATGDICGFLDPDDALQKNAIQKVLQTFAHHKYAAATYSKFFICNEDLQIIKTFPNSRKVDTSSKHFFNINFEVSHFFTFRRDVYFQTEGIRSDLKLSEDMDLYLKLSEAGSFIFINEELYYYRIHQRGLSHDKENLAVKRESWNNVLREAVKRRNIQRIGGKAIDEITDLAEIIYKKENTTIKRLLRKL